MSRPIPDPSATLSPEEARRAYYIDFEGLKVGPPVFVGWLYAEGRAASEDRLVLRHDVFDPTLQRAVDEVSITGFSRHDQEARSLGQSLNDLARRAKAQDRRIVSWSRRELLAVAEAELSPGLLRLFIRASNEPRRSSPPRTPRMQSVVLPSPYSSGRSKPMSSR